MECGLSIFEGAAECKGFVVLVQMMRIRRVIAISYFVLWNDAKKDEEKKDGDMMKAVKSKEVGKSKGMHFLVSFAILQKGPIDKVDIK